MSTVILGALHLKRTRCPRCGRRRGIEYDAKARTYRCTWAPESCTHGWKVKA